MLVKFLALLPLASAVDPTAAPMTAVSGGEKVQANKIVDSIPGGPTIPPEEKLATGADLAAPPAGESPPAAEQAPPAADAGSSRAVDEQKTPEGKPEIQTASVAPDGSVIMSDSRAAAEPEASAPTTTSTTADVAPHEQQEAPATTETAQIAPAPVPASPAADIPAATTQENVTAGESFIAERDDDTTTTTTTTTTTYSYDTDTTTSSTTSVAAEGCFEGSTSLETTQGVVRMDEAKVGDWVRTAIGYEPILGWFHSNKDSQGMTFLKISTDSGEVLTLTPSHVLYMANGVLVAAESLDFGDSILTSDGDVTMVTGIETTSSESGFYNPITASTSVVVNGILASTFTMDLGLFTSTAMLSIHTMIVTGVARVAQLFGLDKKTQPPVAPQVAVASS